MSSGGAPPVRSSVDGPLVVAPQTQVERDQLSKAFEDDYLAQRAKESLGEPEISIPEKVLNISTLLNEGAQAIVDDSFTKCFKSTPSEPWNWNIYLFPLWCGGVCIRYLILFPIRLTLLLGCFMLFFLCFAITSLLVFPKKFRRKLQQSQIRTMCSVFVCSWTGVVKYHGVRPTTGPNKVFVANHTSMIDFIILQQMCGHAAIMQKHGGWVGFLQSYVLEAIGCIQFNRTDIKERHTVAARLREHVTTHESPLLVFPEGTCVNNEFCVMFKKGAFELGVPVHPIAVKYNKIFVDAFWNSKRQSFSQHLFSLMTSWAVVCDVWYLEPQTMGADEDAAHFAERVQDMICKQAGLTRVPWDGMLKYYRPRPALTEKRRQAYGNEVKKLLGSGSGAVRESESRQGYGPVTRHRAAKSNA